MKKEIKINKLLILNIFKAFIIAFLILFVLQITYGKFSWYYPNYQESNFSMRAYFTITHKHIFIDENISLTILNKLPVWIEAIFYDYIIYLIVFVVVLLILELKRNFKIKLT